MDKNWRDPKEEDYKLPSGKDDLEKIKKTDVKFSYNKSSIITFLAVMIFIPLTFSIIYLFLKMNSIEERISKIEEILSEPPRVSINSQDSLSVEDSTKEESIIDSTIKR